MVAGIVVSLVIIGLFMTLMVMFVDSGIFDDYRPKKTRALKNRIAQLEKEKQQLEIELTAYRLNLPWVEDKEKYGTQE